MPPRPRLSSATRWLGVAIGAALALPVAYVFLPLLTADESVLPGRDSVNLYAWELYTRAVLSTGRLPHWNPYHFSGAPHFADPQTTVLYPPAILLRWLEPGLFLSSMAALHVWVNGAGTLFLARVVGLGWLAGSAAAVAAMFGGSMGAWVHNGHLLVLYGVSWLPWALGLGILSARYPARLPNRALVVVLALIVLAGYLQGALYVIGAVSLYFVYCVAWPDGAGRWRPLTQLAALGVLTAGLTAFQLLPATQLVGEAARTAGMAYDEAVLGAWRFADLANMLFPFRGAEPGAPLRGLSDAAAYAGWTLTCLVPFAFFDAPRRRVVVFFAILAAAALALALGDALPFYGWHHDLFPGLRRPVRTLFVVTLSASVVGAIGLERFVTAARGRQWRPLALGSALAVVAVVAAVRVGGGDVNLAQAPMHGWPWVPLMAGAGLVAVWAMAATIGRRPALVAALVLVTVDLTVFAAGSPDPVGVESPATVREWVGPPAAGRVLSMCEHVVGPGELIAVRQPTLDGMAGLPMRSYADWAYIAKTGDMPPDSGIYRRIGGDGGFPARRDLIDAANVTTIVSCEPIEAAALTPVSSPGPLRVYRNETAWPRAWWTCDALESTRLQTIGRLLRSRYSPDRRLVPIHYINVRWASGVQDDRRRAIETRYDLRDGVRQDGRTWRYVAGDASKDTLTAILHDADIEDTHGIDRVTGALAESARDDERDPGEPELVLGERPCDRTGAAMVPPADEGDDRGRIRAIVDAPVAGLVFFSDAYYPARQAFVDGRPTAARKANLAFTAVPVPAGQHVVELRYVPARFHLGAALGAVTLTVWLGPSLIARVRRRERP